MSFKQPLPWHFEAFRRYVPYRKMQQAASVLCRYEGEEFGISNPRMEEILHELQVRTGEPWLPERKVSDSVEFNVEGGFYRNKGRLLTSFFIIEPKGLARSEGPIIKLTQFGRALGSGFVSEREYYDFIVTRMAYPHPAYKENWRIWRKASKTLRPLVFILQILIELYKRDRSHGYTTSEELATFAYPESSHSAVPRIVKKILQNRKKPVKTSPYTDRVNRKINDMLGFLSIAGFTYYDGRLVRLNLMDVHPQERTYYWEKRKTKEYEGANRLKQLEKLLGVSDAGE